MSIYLASKEIWRNRGRFTLFSLVIALITVLVLFTAALAQGLAEANRQYIQKLNAQLLVFQSKVNLSTTASQLDWNKLNSVRRVPGVANVGPIGFSSGNLVFSNGQKPFDVSLVGVLPGEPGDPPVLTGNGLRFPTANEVVIDANVAQRTHLQVGDTLTVKTIIGAKDQFHMLRIVGLTDARQYFYQPTLFLPYMTWDKLRPQPEASVGQANLVANVIAVQLTQPADGQTMITRIKNQVSDVEVADLKTAYESVPGYKAQQSTLNTQQGFTLLIGILVIGGFFQIQTLQKIPQLGMLKAVGTSNRDVAGAVILQIILITILGVTFGSAGTFLLSLGLPMGIPILFTGNTIILATISLLLIGPLGGLVSVYQAIKVEPLTALGL